MHTPSAPTPTLCDDVLTDIDPTAKPELSRKERCKTCLKKAINKVPVILIAPIIAIVVVALLWCIVGPVYLVFVNGASSPQKSLSTTYLAADGTQASECPENDGTETFLQALVTIPFLTPAQVSARVIVEFVASAPAEGIIPGTIRLPSKKSSLVVTFGSFRRVFVDGEALGKVELTEIMLPQSAKSTYVFYPFDSYALYLPWAAYVDVKGDGNRTAIPLCLVTNIPLATFENSMVSNGSIYNYVYQVPPDPSVKGTVSVLQSFVMFQRNGTTLFFSIFIIILLWAITGIMAAVMIDHIWIRPREILPPVASMAITFLFALPAVRNVQPDVPPIGVAVDVVSFFWNMSFVGVCLVIMLSAMIGRTKCPGHQTFKYKST